MGQMGADKRNSPNYRRKIVDGLLKSSVVRCNKVNVLRTETTELIDTLDLLETQSEHVIFSKDLWW